MNVHFDSDVDSLIQEINGCIVYYKSLPQPVYVVEPTEMPPRATILFIHGICEHAFYYFPIAVEWSRKGYQILLFDLQGHGSDGGKIEPLLWLARAYLQVTDAEELAELMKSTAEGDSILMERIRRDHFDRLTRVKMEEHLHQIDNIVHELGSSKRHAGSTPLFLAGHSLGGLLAAEAGWRLGRHGPVVPKGIILFSPALMTISRPSSGFLESTTLGLMRSSQQHKFLLAPVRLAVQAIASLNFKVDTSWVSDWVSDIPEERGLQRMDPLILRTVPSSYLASLEQQMAKTIDRGPNYPVDVIIFAPLNDHVVNTKGSVAFGKALAASRVTEHDPLVLYDNFPYHNLLRSSKRVEILDILYRWLEMHFSSSF